MSVAILALFILEALLAWALWRCLAWSDFALARRLGLVNRPQRPTIYWLRAVVLAILMVGLARAGWLFFFSDGGIVFACARNVSFCP